MVDEKLFNWGLCLVIDVIFVFIDVFILVLGQDKVVVSVVCEQQLIDIEGDQLLGMIIVLQYEGNVVLCRGDQFVGIDKFSFDIESGNYIVDGNVCYQDFLICMVVKCVEGNQESDIYKIIDIKYQLVLCRGNGDVELVDLQGVVGQMYCFIYIICDLLQLVWKLLVLQIEVDNDEGFGIVCNVVLWIGKVLVLWVLYFKFLIDDWCKIGLLFLQLGMFGCNGFDYVQLIYFNLVLNYDDMLILCYMSWCGLMFDNEFCYFYNGGRGELLIVFMFNDKLCDCDRGWVMFSGYYNVDSYWQVCVNLVWVSDECYVEDFVNCLVGVIVLNLQSIVGLYGIGRNWMVGIMVDCWQLIDYMFNESVLLYNCQLCLYFNWDKLVLLWLEIGIYVEVVCFIYDDINFKYGVDVGFDLQYMCNGQIQCMYGGLCLDVKLYVLFLISGVVWYVILILVYCYIGYDLDQGFVDSVCCNVLVLQGIDLNIVMLEQLCGNKLFSCSLLIGSIDVGLFFDCEIIIGGKLFLYMLELCLFYLCMLYCNQDELLIFDICDFIFSWGQLFCDLCYIGVDCQNDVNQLILVLGICFIDQIIGKECFLVVIGQIQYFDELWVIVILGGVLVEKGKLVWIVDGNYMINDCWILGVIYQWDLKYKCEDLVSVCVCYLMFNDGVINFSYCYCINLGVLVIVNKYDCILLEQVDLLFLYLLNVCWSLVGCYYYLLQDKELLEIIVGVQWDSCCLVVCVVVCCYVCNCEGEMNNVIQLEFVFKGLSFLGQDMDCILCCVIFGYNCDDFYFVLLSNIGVIWDDYDLNLIL